METWNIVIISIMIPSIGFLFVQQLQLVKNMTRVQMENSNISETMKSVKDDVKQIRNDLHIFIKSEVDYLKDIAKK